MHGRIYNIGTTDVTAAYLNDSLPKDIDYVTEIDTLENASADREGIEIKDSCVELSEEKAQAFVDSWIDSIKRVLEGDDTAYDKLIVIDAIVTTPMPIYFWVQGSLWSITNTMTAVLQGFITAGTYKIRQTFDYHY